MQNENKIKGENDMAGFKFPKIDAASVQERFKDNLKGMTKQTQDPRFYVLTKDKNGNGSAVIRFLPGVVVDGKELLSYSVVYRHNLQLSKHAPFLSTICPTTLGQKCPICEWNKLQEESWVKNNNTYRKRKYISNILVIEESIPELIGQVKLFEYGPQIMKILESKIYPKQIGTKKKDPMIYYDWETGANFELVLVKDKSQSWPTWDNSEFLAQSSIMEFLDEKGIDPRSIVDSLYDTELVIKDLEIPSYDKIKNDLHEWLANNNLPTEGPTDTIASVSSNRSSFLQNAKSRAAVEEVDESTNDEAEDELDGVAGKSTFMFSSAPKSEPSNDPIGDEDPTAKFKKFKNFMGKNKNQS